MNKDYISTSALYGPYLAHYGIKGQKWGIRRYQNSDGTLTAEGAKRYGSVKEMKKAVKDEYKKDQSLATRLGNYATQTAYAYNRQKKTVERAEKRAAKNPTEKNKKKLDIEKIVASQLKEVSEGTKAIAERHYESLKKKYGSKAMKDIRYNKNGDFNEDNGATLWNIFSGLGAMGMAYTSGFGVGILRETNKQAGYRYRDLVRYNEYAKNKPQK